MHNLICDVNYSASVAYNTAAYIDQRSVIDFSAPSCFSSLQKAMILTPSPI